KLDSRVQVSGSQGFQSPYKELVEDDARNKRICDDVIESVRNGRSPLVLTERNEHLDRLERGLADTVRCVVALRAGLGKRQRQAIDDRLASISPDEPRVILATGKYVGEGLMTETRHIVPHLARILARHDRPVRRPLASSL